MDSDTSTDAGSGHGFNASVSAKRPGAGAHAVNAGVLGRQDGAKPRRGYAGRSAEELRGERMERLLDAALTLFSERGYAKTPIEMICTRARVTTRHFYEQFDGREALLAHLYRQIIADARKAVFAAFQQPGASIEQRMYGAIRAYIRSYTDDRRRAHVVCIEVIGVSEEISRMRRDVVSNFAAIIESFAKTAARDGDIPQREYRLGALCMVGATNELMTDWLTSVNPPSVPELAEQLVRFYTVLIVGARTMGKVTPGFNPDALR